MQEYREEGGDDGEVDLDLEALLQPRISSQQKIRKAENQKKEAH
jgi:hypothetical protein